MQWSLSVINIVYDLLPQYYMVSALKGVGSENWARQTLWGNGGGGGSYSSTVYEKITIALTFMYNFHMYVYIFLLTSCKANYFSGRWVLASLFTLRTAPFRLQFNMSQTFLTLSTTKKEKVISMMFLTN